MQHLIKGSFAFFTYNAAMAVLALGFSPDIAEAVTAWLPFKGTVVSGLCFLLFSLIDGKFFQWYQVLLDCTLVAYAVFEMTQVCHIVFIISRFFKSRIDFQDGCL